ncbi:hypothetical protein OPV22_007004 [Ensete ventricosum]|uniref:Uncharacterized protein n=1 Tax=Ensete ventricosum TaxID=4639 RepID=A0AAV8RK65_ENSVE|nr:hypothetical protein OPV22_007004 [Ensete ventricosum]
MKGENETDSLFLSGRHHPGICGEHFSVADNYLPSLFAGLNLSVRSWPSSMVSGPPKMFWYFSWDVESQPHQWT